MASVLDKPSIMYGSEEYPLFTRLQIETSAYCNRTCHFCPMSMGRRPKQILMKDALFYKIIKEMYELKQFKANIRLFLLNEPLIDPGLFKKAKLARTALPKCTIYISTNGDAIDFRGKKTLEWSLTKLKAVYDSGINSINLNVYDDGPEQFERYSAIYSEAIRLGIAQPLEHKYRRVPDPKLNWLYLTDMRPNRESANIVDFFYSRTEEDRPESVPDAYCARTQRHLVVLYDGRVPICCTLDPTGKDVVWAGDLNTQKMLEVWNSEIFFKYRYFTQFGSRRLPECDSCNDRMAYAWAVRHVDAPIEVKQHWANSLRSYETQKAVERANKPQAELVTIKRSVQYNPQMMTKASGS